MSYLGREVIEHIDRLEDDAVFWERWMDRLHPDEKAALAYGEIGIIKRPVEPTWAVGEWMEVASNLWLRPHRPKYTHRGWRITFDLRDFRVNLVRRVPTMFEPPELDSQGYPVAHDKDAIEHARIDGNYTAAHALSVEGADESMDEFTQRRLTDRTRKAEREEIDRLYIVLEDLRSAVKERLEGNPEAVKIMGRDAWALRSKIDSVERRLKRRRAA